jgi:hypothetical protein
MNPNYEERLELERLEKDMPQIKDYLDFLVRATSTVPCEHNLRVLLNTLDDYHYVIGNKAYGMYLDKYKELTELAR